ncbi:MAG: methyltransferase domain-containing protein [Bacteroidetes bacterium]|nr:MAG: methyltransferase domain-containing protein [Bacteroidota bacterium]
MKGKNGIICSAMLVALVSVFCHAQPGDRAEVDRKVRDFLESRAGQWYDMNVPTNDGRLLYDIIVEKGYRNALEIGTSTGHSTIWIAWALSKTGGKVITIEIDESRYREALDNFKKAGLEDYIDARLADAHELVPELEGPFDFVFSDADKAWYRNYFLAVDPKLEVNGCYTTHNVSDRPGGWSRDYLEFLRGLDHYETSVNNEGNGLAISYKVNEGQRR